MAKTRTAIGLDFGTQSVKAAWAHLSGSGPVVTRTEILSLSAEGQNDEFILAWLEKQGLLKTPCAIALPGHQAVFQPITLPGDDPRTLRQVAEIEVERFNDMASASMTYGFCESPANPGERRLLLALSRPSAIRDALVSARFYGVAVVELIPTPVATFNAVEAVQGQHENPYLLINVGHTRTDISVGLPKGLLFARTFPAAGEAFTRALADTMDIPITRAGNLKITKGSLVDGDEAMLAALRPVADMWTQEVQSVLSVYTGLYPERTYKPAKIILSGGGSQLNGFREHVEKSLEIQTVLVEALPGKADIADPAQFDVAAGCAMAVLGQSISQLTMLPVRDRDELMFRQKKPIWIAAGVAAALAIIVAFTGLARTMGRDKDTIRVEEKHVAECDKIGRRINVVKNRIAKCRAMAQPLVELLHSGPISRDIVTLLAESLHPDDWIAMVCDWESYNTVPGGASKRKRPLGLRDPRTKPKKDAKRPDEPPREFIIEGYTPHSDMTTVKDLTDKLAASKLISSADLLVDDAVQPAWLFRPAPTNAALSHFVVKLDVKQK